MVDLFFNIDHHDTQNVKNIEIDFKPNDILNFLKKIREYFYILFITNLDIKKILNHFMSEFIGRIEDLELKFNIINVISEYEVRICEGTRYIVHVEAMMIKLLKIVNKGNIKSIANSNDLTGISV